MKFFALLLCVFAGSSAFAIGNTEIIEVNELCSVELTALVVEDPSVNNKTTPALVCAKTREALSKTYRNEVVSALQIKILRNEKSWRNLKMPIEIMIDAPGGYIEAKGLFTMWMVIKDFKRTFNGSVELSQVGE